MKITVAELVKVTGGRIVQGGPARTASGVSTDSRSLEKGQGFVALKGPNFDGHNFIARAMKNGAPWVIAQKGAVCAPLPGKAALIEVDDTLEALGKLAAACRRRFKVKVVAVTGSVGKSTTKEMIAEILSAKGRVMKNRGNLNNLIGLPLTMFGLNRAHDFAVLEMGCNVPGEIAKLTKIAAPDVGIITRVAPVHLEGLGSIQGVAKAKAELIKELGPQKTFVLNLDDPLIGKKARAFKGQMVGYSMKETCSFSGKSLHILSMEKDVIASRPIIRFMVQQKIRGKAKGRPVEFTLPTLSRNNAQNALAAAAVGLVMGVSLSEAARRLKGFQGLAGRGEVVKTRRNLFVMNDTYNASPASVAEALDTMAWWRGPLRGVAVLGEMLELGKEAEKYHRRIGEKVAGSGIEILVAKGPHAKAMAAAAKKAGLPAKNAIVVKDNREALGRLQGLLEAGDWVLVKGSRAMAMEEVARALMR